MTTQPSQVVLINGFGALFVVFNAFGLGLRLPVGKLLAQAFAHWKIAVWTLVINFVVIPVLFVGYLLTIASSIPDEIKVGFCVAALCAGTPFAPLLAQLSKANVSIATMLLGAWDLFVQTWGTGSYIAALAGPFIGLGVWLPPRYQSSSRRCGNQAMRPKPPRRYAISLPCS